MNYCFCYLKEDIYEGSGSGDHGHFDNNNEDGTNVGTDLEVDNGDYVEEDFHEGSGYGQDELIHHNNKADNKNVDSVTKPPQEEVEKIR